MLSRSENSMFSAWFSRVPNTRVFLRHDAEGQDTFQRREAARTRKSTRNHADAKDNCGELTALHFCTVSMPGGEFIKASIMYLFSRLSNASSLNARSDKMPCQHRMLPSSCKERANIDCSNTTICHSQVFFSNGVRQPHGEKCKR